MRDLTNHNTLGVPARASEVYTVTSLPELVDLAPRARSEGLLVLGGGSNVVLATQIEVPVCLMRIRGIEMRAKGNQVLLTVGAGENWHDLVRFSLGQGLAGLENLALIPGSVGAAPVQNIGAYGVELRDRIVALEAMEVASGKVHTLTAAECEFGYRTSLFKRRPGHFIIARVTLSLSPSSESHVTSYPGVQEELDRMGRRRIRPLDVAEAIIRIRRRKLPDPRRVPNVGSFFKNPVIGRSEYAGLAARWPQLRAFPETGGVKLSAAQLIAHCAETPGTAVPVWAREDSAVRIWPRQALVLTNPGRRPGTEVLSTAAGIRDAVQKRFGVRLELEPDTVGMTGAF